MTEQTASTAINKQRFFVDRHTTRDLVYILLGNGTTMGNWIVHPWIQLKSNPGIHDNVKVLGAILEAVTLRLGAIGASTFTGNTATAAYECFDPEFAEN
ncbi:MAG: hypothetical protein QW510_07240 [Candidatus Bathyarchaeia archaeon]